MITREEAIETYMMNSHRVVAEMLYDTIDRYESRICWNCRFNVIDYIIDAQGFRECKNKNSLLYGANLSGINDAYIDFGCNQFERKDTVHDTN